MGDKLKKMEKRRRSHSGKRLKRSEDELKQKNIDNGSSDDSDRTFKAHDTPKSTPNASRRASRTSQKNNNNHIGPFEIALTDHSDEYQKNSDLNRSNGSNGSNEEYLEEEDEYFDDE